MQKGVLVHRIDFHTLTNIILVKYGNLEITEHYIRDRASRRIIKLKKSLLINNKFSTCCYNYKDNRSFMSVPLVLQL